MASKRRKRRWMKILHKWPSLVIAIFIILWAFSGIILNHRHTFSSIDVNSKMLPAEHQYNNWNNAALRGAVHLDSTRTWFYGNVGVWEYIEIKDRWVDRRQGLPGGADHHKVNCLILTKGGELFSGTRFGLYRFNSSDSSWTAMPLPDADNHVVDIVEIDDSLYVLSRSHLWRMPLSKAAQFEYMPVPAPAGYDNKVGLFKTMWVIHSGEIYGIAGKLLVDAVAAIFIFLTVSGLIYFFFPRLIKKRKRKKRDVKQIAFWNKWSIKWHNKIGIWLVIILIITTFTGMFLRPPLLIAIASGRVSKIPHSVLDDGNPWYDKLRRIIHDEHQGKVLLATSEGIYGVDEKFRSSPVFMHPQPPVSVMGYNVFTQLNNGKFLVGSFSGIFSWDPAHNAVQDYITGLPYRPPAGMSSPISANMISGYYADRNGGEHLFDYNTGVMSSRFAKSFPAMPEKLIRTRIPLWNFALELHTARLFKPFMGDFYILFIPLFGLSTLIILISGIVLWVRKYIGRRKHK